MFGWSQAGNMLLLQAKPITDDLHIIIIMEVY